MSSRERARNRAFRGRDFHADAFSNGGAATSEDIDPMSGIANVVDAMLVFACGLLIALALASGVNISELTAQYTPTGEMQSVDDPGDVTTSKEDGGKGYQEAGTAYYDPDTGKYFIEVQE